MYIFIYLLIPSPQGGIKPRLYMHKKKLKKFNRSFELSETSIHLPPLLYILLEL